ncbi:MAG: nucleotidyltransferase domain-containing protein [Anaerolineae bacterium]|nr:nucleotidyltransferase domain-containing protein [Anaerolineae bacterium]
MTDRVKLPPTLDELRAQREEILAVARRNKAFNVRVFGSVARGDAAADSDIDLLVEFEPDASLYDVSGLRLDLIDLLGREVDVVELHAQTQKRFREKAMKDAVLL